MTDIYTVVTEYGEIVITKNVIGKIIVDAVSEFEGKVLITNHKGKAQGLVSKIGGIEPISNLDIVFKEKGIDIRVFVAIRFGTSIGYVTNTLIDLIHERVKRVIGKDPDSVAVVVSGIISKNMAKRNIEVMRRYDGK